MDTSNRNTRPNTQQRTNTNNDMPRAALREPRSLPPRITIQQEQIVKTKRKRIKRSYGNRKLRRFQKKCRKRGKTDEQIRQMMDEYHHGRNREDSTHQRLTNASTTVENMEITTTVPSLSSHDTTADRSKRANKKSEKRKRIPTSVSSRSISTLAPHKKKLKKKKREADRTAAAAAAHVQSAKTTSRIPKYLKLLPNLLFQTLRIHLHYPLKKKKEKRYVHYRLQLLDRQYRLELHRSLWQSYLTLGSQHHLWANQVYELAKTNEHALCQQFVTNRLTKLNQEYDQYTMKLVTQSHTCPSTLLPLETLDQNLLKFVQLQEKYIWNKMNAQLARFKDLLHEKELYQNLLSSHLTTDQTLTIDRLNQLRQDQFKVYEKYFQLQTHISIDYLPRNYNRLENFIRSDRVTSSIQDNLTVDFTKKQHKIIQETKRTWLNVNLNAYERQIQQFEQQYQQNLSQFEQHLLQNPSPNGTTALYNSLIIYLNHRTNRIEQEIYHEKIPVYRRRLSCLRRRNLKSIKKRVSVLPQMILDIPFNPFTVRELNYLSKGPAYIRPNQSALRPYEHRLKNIQIQLNKILDKVKDYMANLRHRPQLSRDSSFYKLYSDRLQTYLSDSYMTALPFIDLVRARRELRIVRSIRYKLIKYQLLLRKTDKSGVLHIGRMSDYEQKAIQYREKTRAYQELPTNPFNDTFLKTIQLLNRLEATKQISPKQKNQMLPIREKTQLAYKYYLPKAHKRGTPLRPIMNTIHAATTKVSKFLDQLIRPLFDHYAHNTTIIDGVDLLHKLQKYIQQNRFKSSTLFVTFDITDLYTMLPQEESLKILAEFLREQQCEKVNGISIDTIVELARLVLENNAFVYRNQFYRQIIGGAMGSAFTLTLANIFMWKWQKETILSKLSSHELYGRYIDDVFFTWNGSEKELREILDQANKFHSNIKLTYTIGKTTPFLDLLLQNNNGTLSSSVYHKPAAEPAVLSFLSDHPRYVFRNVIRTALTRAIRYSSTFEAFNRERREIHLKLLYNGYPPTFIHTQFHRFFSESMPSSSPSSILPLINDEHQFFLLRQKLLAQPTAKQAAVASRIARVEIINNQLAGDGASNVRQRDTRPTTAVIVKERNDNKFKNTIFIHCQHEARMAGLNRYIHEIHDSIFKMTDFGDIRLIVSHRNNPDIEYELSRKRPPSHLLKDQPKPKRIKKSKRNPISRTTTG